MFEDSLLESSGQMKTKKGTMVLISTAVHTIILVVLILIPLISYSELPRQQLMTMLIAPPPPPPPPPPLPTEVAPPKPVVIKQVQIDRGADRNSERNRKDRRCCAGASWSCRGHA